MSRRSGSAHCGHPPGWTRSYTTAPPSSPQRCQRRPRCGPRGKRHSLRVHRDSRCRRSSRDAVRPSRPNPQARLGAAQSGDHPPKDVDGVLPTLPRWVCLPCSRYRDGRLSCRCRAEGQTNAAGHDRLGKAASHRRSDLRTTGHVRNGREFSGRAAQGRSRAPKFRWPHRSGRCWERLHRTGPVDRGCVSTPSFSTRPDVTVPCRGTPSTCSRAQRAARAVERADRRRWQPAPQWSGHQSTTGPRVRPCVVEARDVTTPRRLPPIRRWESPRRWPKPQDSLGRKTSSDGRSRYLHQPLSNPFEVRLTSRDSGFKTVAVPGRVDSDHPFRAWCRLGDDDEHRSPISI